MNFECSYTQDEIILRALPPQRGFLSRVFSRSDAGFDLARLPSEDYELGAALDTIHSLADKRAGQPDWHLVVEGDTLRLGHRLAAAIDDRKGTILGLPPLTNLVLHTDMAGSVGRPGFKLYYYWKEHGKRRNIQRQGAILELGKKGQRIPLWMLEALDLADKLVTGQEAAGDWAALARFRQALSPSSAVAEEQEADCLEMSRFLKGLEISLVSRLSISPNDARTDFEVVPFSKPVDDDDDGPGQDSGPLSEKEAELEGAPLRTFQRMLRGRGALNAYALNDGKADVKGELGRRYVVIDPSVRPALETMLQAQRASLAERQAFIENPTLRLREAYESRYRSDTDYKALSSEEREEKLAESVEAAFVETEEYSARVVGSVFDTGEDALQRTSSGTIWLPEGLRPYEKDVSSSLNKMSPAELEAFSALLEEKISEGGEEQKAEPDKVEHISVAGHDIPATVGHLRALRELVEEAHQSATHDGAVSGDSDTDTRQGRIILAPRSNLEQQSWVDHISPRKVVIPASCPESIQTSLKAHQRESLQWQIQAWCAGLPGILNADEQGLGKTLQTISFLVWLNRNMLKAREEGLGSIRPVLVVAPTTLLRNWEEEVEKHVLKGEGLGDLVRLYDTGVQGRRKRGTEGRDIDTGQDKLDLSDVENRAGAGRSCWILTTYTTLTNYQYSFGKLDFSAVVFDEIQALKNPVTLGAKAARVVKADFRIGLTGTPVENDMSELWAIMDVLASMPKGAAGYLGSLQYFRETYKDSDDAGMKELHGCLFKGSRAMPPLAIRREKKDVAGDLPKKKRYLYPEVMPERQARQYEEAREKLLHSNKGAALKILHHIRGVSMHPALDEVMPSDDFIAMSARLKVTFELLEKIRSKGERVLVFIESIEMQYRFIRLVKERFGLANIDVINGKTEQKQRQDIVNKFQKHLQRNDGFDLLVLSPKAAGVGLTLTAATHVIHLSRWWNPAVEEQCNDRVHRIGQEHPVSIHVPLAVHPGYQYQSFDLLLQTLMQKKRRRATSILQPMGATQSDDATLEAGLKKAGKSQLHGKQVAGDSSTVIRTAMKELFEHEGVKCDGPDGNGRWEF